MAQLAVRNKKENQLLEAENIRLKSILQSIASEGDDCLITSDLAAGLIQRAKDAI